MKSSSENKYDSQNISTFINSITFRDSSVSGTLITSSNSFYDRIHQALEEIDLNDIDCENDDNNEMQIDNFCQSPKLIYIPSEIPLDKISELSL